MKITSLHLMMASLWTYQDELSFVEIQTGDYFGEDDIERIEDDFGRT